MENINDVLKAQIAERMQNNVAAIKALKDGGMGYADIMHIASALWGDSNKQDGQPVDSAAVPVMPGHINKAKLKALEPQISIYDSWINYKPKTDTDEL